MKDLLSERLMIVMPERHRSATAAVLGLEQFANDNFVVCRRYADPGWRELVEGTCREAGFTPKVRQSVEHKQTLLALVAQGLGVSIVPASAAEQAAGIRYRPLPPTAPRLMTALVWRQETPTDLIDPLLEVAEREAARFDSKQLSVTEFGRDQGVELIAR